MDYFALRLKATQGPTGCSEYLGTVVQISYEDR